MYQAEMLDYHLPLLKGKTMMTITITRNDGSTYEMVDAIEVMPNLLWQSALLVKSGDVASMTVTYNH